MSKNRKGLALKKSFFYLLAVMSPLFPPSAYGSLTIPPDSLVRVELSATDVNRVVCEGGEIKDVVYSKEKGLIVKASGSDVYVKFQVFQKEDKLVYDEAPSEMYISCEESVYSLIATPVKTPSVTVRLADRKNTRVKGNAAVFKGLVYEEKVLKFLKMAYMDELSPDTFSIEEVQGDASIPETRFSSMELRLRRVVRTEGFVLKEYRVVPGDDIEVREVDFMLLVERPAAIALDSTVMKRDFEYRLFVIDQAPGLR